MGPPGSPRQAPNYAVRVASSRYTNRLAHAWRRLDRRPNFRAGRGDASRFAFAVVRSEAARRVAFDPRLVPALVGPDGARGRRRALRGGPVSCCASRRARRSSRRR